MIEPTIGRRVWYWPSAFDCGQTANVSPSIIQSDLKQPCDAGIAYVHSDRMVNLTVADHNGEMHRRTSVTLLQDDDPVPVSGAYATWMDYQKKQANQSPPQPPADNAHVAPGCELFSAA